MSGSHGQITVVPAKGNSVACSVIMCISRYVSLDLHTDWFSAAWLLRWLFLVSKPDWDEDFCMLGYGIQMDGTDCEGCTVTWYILVYNQELLWICLSIFMLGADIAPCSLWIDSLLLVLWNPVCSPVFHLWKVGVKGKQQSPNGSMDVRNNTSCKTIHWYAWFFLCNNIPFRKLEDV